MQRSEESFHFLSHTIVTRINECKADRGDFNKEDMNRHLIGLLTWDI